LKKKYRGIVLEMSGLGHVPTSRARKGKSWIKKLKEVQKKGIIVCATSQTIYGRVDPFVYSNGREILGTGVIYLEDMLPETALVKLGHVLSKTSKKEEVKNLMLKNIAKEINYCLEKN
jgi:glutamyl-tRNA(Gln) amidotransferase subunit D